MTAKTAQTRRAKLEARESAIIDAARSTFADAGFDGARMADIAKKAGVSEGTLYLYFENKLALMQAVITGYYEALTQAGEDGLARLPDTRERLAFLARLHVTRMMDNWQILMQASFIFRDRSGYGQSTQYALNKTYVGLFDRIIADARARGEMGEDTPLWVLRDLFFGGLEYAMRTARVRGQLKQSAKISQAMMPAFLAACGLAAAGQQPASDRLEQLVDRLEAAINQVTDTP